MYSYCLDKSNMSLRQVKTKMSLRQVKNKDELEAGLNCLKPTHHNAPYFLEKFCSMERCDVLTAVVFMERCDVLTAVVFMERCDGQTAVVFSDFGRLLVHAQNCPWLM